MLKTGDKVIFDSMGADSSLKSRDLEKATIIRPLTSNEADLFEVGNMYKIVFEDGFETDAFEDELIEVKEKNLAPNRNK